MMNFHGRRHLMGVFLLPAILMAEDRTVPVASPGRKDNGTWVDRDTRTLGGLSGYKPQGAVMTGPFGGWAEKKEKATGFFHAKKIGDRWWLIDPEGGRYLSQGLNQVDAPGYNWGEVRKVFGSEENWVRATSSLLRSNGFNTVGGWSSDRLDGKSAAMSRTLTFHVMEGFAKEKKLIVRKDNMSTFLDEIVPVFHPDFPAWCDKAFAGLASTKTDPWVLGIFSDNELPFARDLLGRTLKVTDKTPDLVHNKTAALAWLRDEIGSEDYWSKPNEQRAELSRKFVALAYETYYKTIKASIRKVDPNHLYLGSRILAPVGHVGTNDALWTAMAKNPESWPDVISLNYYDVWGPSAEAVAKWAQWADKPLMITEWYAKAQDVAGLANTGGMGWLVKTQEDRARYYQHYVLGCLEAKNIVGWHWFKYQDDPTTANRGDNAGGANKGLVDGEFRPHALLLDHAGAVQREAYRLTEYFDQR